jgi:hypothetical protein
VTGHVPVSNGRFAAHYDLIQQVAGTTAVHRTLDGLSKKPRRRARDKKVEGKSNAPESSGDRRAGRDGEDVAELHDRPDGTVEGSRPLIDELEYFSFDRPHGVAPEWQRRKDENEDGEQ